MVLAIYQIILHLNEITFEKKLHDEVPSGKNYIIKNIKGKDFIVVKNLEGPSPHG
jgi:hypothetical protein